MSLFENSLYQWRETYFVLHDANNRPSVSEMQTMLDQLDERYEYREIRATDDGKFEAVTIYCPTDCSAMDVTFADGEDVAEAKESLCEQLRLATLSAEDRERLAFVEKCDARLDVFHFERAVMQEEGDEEILDPGALLIILEHIAELCKGVAVDPQSGELM